MKETKSNFLSRCIPFSKTVVIALLAILSIILTIQLWLVHIPSHSFFPYLEARFAPTAPDGAADFVRPFRIVSSNGDGYFDITYSGIASNPLWQYGEDAIERLIDGGAFVARTTIDMDMLFSQPAILYEYAFCMEPQVFAQAFGVRTGASIANVNMPNFRAIVIHPPIVAGGVLDAFFVCEGYTWHFTLSPTGRHVHEIFYGIDISSAAGMHRRFVLTAEHKYDAPFTFLPDFHEDFSYHPILAINPYENAAGLLNLAFIRNRVAHFFDNPSNINAGLTGGIYTFGNLNAVVRYHPWDVVEYTSFRTIGSTAASSFIDDFSAAIAFVYADVNIVNEVFLAGYESRGRENIFWFSYAIENFPLRIDAPWYSSSTCNDPLLFPIEIVVDHGRVIRYRKVAFSFMVDTSITSRLDMHMLHGQERPFGFVIEPLAGRHLLLQVLE